MVFLGLGFRPRLERRYSLPLAKSVDDAQVRLVRAGAEMTEPGGQSGRPSSRAPSTSPSVVTSEKCGNTTSLLVADDRAA